MNIKNNFGVNRKPVRVLAIASGKGGVGKTNVSVNLAISLSHAGQKTLILDADLGLANIDVMLGLQPKYNLRDVFNGSKKLKDIIVDGPAGIKIIPASSGFQEMSDLSNAQHAGLIQAFSEFDDEIDVLIIDTAAGISDSVVTFSRAAQDVIVVVCDEPASITDAYALIKLLHRDYNIYRFRILSNMVHSAQEGRDVYQKLAKVSDKFLDVTLDYMGFVPFDEYLRKAVKRQRAVVEAFPRSKASTSFKNLAERTQKWPIPKIAAGHLEFFVERLIQGNLNNTGVMI
ncbi:MAG: MinD/ParA family protein [Thiohalomonadales bacterium]